MDGEQGESEDRGGGAPGGGPAGELALLRAAVQAVGEAVVVTGPGLDPPGPLIEYVNPAFERMTGYAAAECLGRSPRFLQGPRTDRAVLARLRAALAAGREFQGENTNYRRDGSEFAVEWLIAPVRDGAGRVAHWVSAQRDVTERRRAEERQRRLAGELSHRINNSLAAVQSIAAQTLGGARAAFQGRLLALARVHALLARAWWEGVPLADLAEAQLAPVRGGPGLVEAAGPEVRLRPEAAVALGLALGELAANAAAHGALSAPGGRVRLRWSVAPGPGGGRLRLEWSEAGGPAVPGPPARRGFGTRLVERGLAHGLRARVRLSFEPAGLRLELDAPLDALA
jgi:PAS domain S-box-containing protein